MTTAPATDAAGPASTFRILRGVWLFGTIVLSVGAFALAIGLAPSGSAPPDQALGSLLFLGSSVHVAATGWFFFLPEVRRHAMVHRVRYVVVPVSLIAGGALVAMLLPDRSIHWALLAYFAWQFYHFQKQNLGLAALAGVSSKVGSLDGRERLGIVVAGIGGIAGLITHPDLLQLNLPRPLGFLFPVAGLVFVVGVGIGLYALATRHQRTTGLVTMYLIALFFFAPVFVFQSPYAAVAGLTIAHGYQYLLIVGLVAGAPRKDRSGPAGVALLMAVALFGGVLLDVASHLHTSPHGFARALYGAYLGAVMAHFVIDAGLWRLRDEFPRRFLGGSLPYLLRP
jgi:hypothetical protein